MKCHCSFLAVLLCATSFLLHLMRQQHDQPGSYSQRNDPLWLLSNTLAAYQIISSHLRMLCFSLPFYFLRLLETSATKDWLKQAERSLTWAHACLSSNKLKGSVSNSCSLLHSWIVQSYSTSFGEDFKHNKVSEPPLKKNIFQPFSHQLGICVLFPTCGPSRTD